MDLRRLRAGEWIAAASGLVLVLSLFLPWYTIEVPSHGSTSGREVGGTLRYSAWEAFSAVDVLLLVLGVLAVGLLILTAAQPTAALGIAADALLTIVASIVAVVTVIRLLDIPGTLEIPDHLGVDTARAPFAWIGLAAVLGVLAGAVVAMRDERLSAPGEDTDATGVPLSSPPEVETLPAPPRGPAEG